MNEVSWKLLTIHFIGSIVVFTTLLNLGVCSTISTNGTTTEFQMAQIMMENAHKTNVEVATILYKHFSAKFPTKMWLFIVYDAIIGYQQHTIGNGNYNFVFRKGRKNALAFSVPRWKLLKQREDHIDTVSRSIEDFCTEETETKQSVSQIQACRRKIARCSHYTALSAYQEMFSSSIVPIDMSLAVISRSANVKLRASPDFKFISQFYQDSVCTVGTRTGAYKYPTYGLCIFAIPRSLS